MSDPIPAFQSLSARQGLHVLLNLRLGRAPKDAHEAAAAVEWAREFDRRGCARLLRAFTIVMFVVSTAAVMFFASIGATLPAVGTCAVAVTELLHIILMPDFWPRRVARAADASEQKLITSGINPVATQA